jgi:hypothetical protein
MAFCEALAILNDLQVVSLFKGTFWAGPHKQLAILFHRAK